MNLKRAMGISILLMAFTAICIPMVEKYGVEKTAFIWAISLILTAAFATAIHFIINDES